MVVGHKTNNGGVPINYRDYNGGCVLANTNKGEVLAENLSNFGHFAGKKIC